MSDFMRNTRCAHSDGMHGWCSGPVKNNLCTNHQYWLQHGQMLQWFFASHRNAEATHVNNFFPSYYVPQEQQVSVPEHRNSPPDLCSNSGRERFASSCKVPHAVKNGYIKRDESESSSSSESSLSEQSSICDSSVGDNDNEYDNDSDSDGELVFDADGIFAMRAAKEDSIKDNGDDSDNDSIELIDAMVDEKFEFVELDSFGKLREVTVTGVKYEPNTKEEFDSAKEWQNHLYGDKAERIICLETPMSNNFDKLCDTYQPTVFPAEL
ncbi:hypothetical protein TNCT_331901 [Trichonephila clavata]|uniref:Uncharacterized protein n=1 Tax=Trichonephila clavata TaxID=2740835 RepID=A0A8X6H798_TRICU|nr:hypothetical protein TNCT_331901 [Trichonephila clavata]